MQRGISWGRGRDPLGTGATGGAGPVRTQAQDDVSDVGRQDVHGVAVHVLRGIGGAVAPHVHSHDVEALLELPELVAPAEPVGPEGEVEAGSPSPRLILTPIRGLWPPHLPGPRPERRGLPGKG